MNIANNTTIKKHLFDRWEELGLKPSKIIDDAMEREPSFNFSRSTFSRWSKGVKGGFSEKQILWFCIRWGINISVNIGTPSLTADNRLQWTIQPYNELECLKKLKSVFIKIPIDPKKDKKLVKKK